MEMHAGLVHFPIALLVTGAVFELLGRILKHNGLRESAHYVIVGAAIFGLATVGTGLVAARDMTNPEIAKTLGQHRILGLSVVSISIMLSLWRVLPRRAMSRTAGILYMGLLMVAAGLAMGTGWLGGQVADSHHSHGEHSQHLDNKAPAHDADHHEEIGSHDH